ncbi:MAG: TonB family protein [Kiritimatiellae bacterium]|nr:TonB family protein [Kiritimatiellia bacterium]
MANEIYTRSLTVSFVAHAAVIGVFLLVALVQGCIYRHKKVELIEFTVAVNSGDVEEPPDEQPPEPKEPEKLREPDKPPELPPEPDRIPEPKKEVKKPPEKKPEPKKPDPPKPTENKKKPIDKGKRIKAPPQPKPVRQTMSDAEIEKWLNRRARVGTVDSLPTSEQALNFALVRNALHEAWDQPPRADSGSRPAEVEFTLDSAGRISAPRIVQSSGSAVFDASVLTAVRAAGRIPGLSARFLKEYPKLSVEFKLEE